MKPGIISEWDYEEYIDRAYGRGADLRETKLWKPAYERGFVCPDDNGGWLAFAYDGRRYRFLGTYGFDDVFEAEKEDPYEKRERLLLEADTSSVPKGIDILRRLYTDPDFRQEATSVGLKIAQDDECIVWICDYWDYVKWNEHGNECALSEAGFGSFVEDILDPHYALEYLMPEGREKAGTEEKLLADRLMVLHRRYSG
jgi:hypothetical protein